MLKSSFSISSLHTSRVEFYSNFGYHRHTLDFANATVSVDENNPGGAVLAVSPIHAVTPEWKDLHAHLLQSHKFHGLLERSDEYWTYRVPKEVQRLCGKQALKKAFSPRPLAHDTDFPHGSAFQWVDLLEPSLSAVFLSAQYDEEGEKLPILKIHEFIASDDLMADISTAKMVFASFIRASVSSSWKKFIINCPGALWRYFVDPLSWISLLGPYHMGHLEIDTSDAIMYKTVDGTKIDELATKDHLFLALDSF